MITYELKQADNFEDAARQLYEIITLLRSRDGCPWDRKQTPKSALESLIDEAYEYLDGVYKKDISSCREEIGDILINAFMILEIHDEYGDFTPAEAINEVCAKLIRRHPHVFGDVKAQNAEDGLSMWNNVKKTEGKVGSDAKAIFNHIPSALPPLERAFEIQKKMEKFAFDFPNVEGVLEKVAEEFEEVKEAIAGGDSSHMENELGDLLFSVVNLCRFLKVRPNVALEKTNLKTTNRFKTVCRVADEKKIPMDKEHTEEMNALWEQAKGEEN